MVLVLNAVGVSGIIAGILGTGATPSGQPNILFLFADDWGWPHASCLGDPIIKTPTFEPLANDTYAAFPNCDTGPTKAWILTQRDEPSVKPFFEQVFGKRPARELYDLKRDPYELRNVADAAAYAGVLRKLDSQLMAELKATGDPRASGGSNEFDRHQSTG